ncbi:MAG: NERD domain-containing protein [Clostridia bacterium]|nr:NERD domain-containing protein [Clostridia bacterium]
MSDLALFEALKKKLFLPFSDALGAGKERVSTRLLGIRALAYYKRSPYFAQTARPFDKLKTDRGAYGEYLLSLVLKAEKGRWLFNVYLPTDEEHTEIDALFICDRGVFVLESKNFKGRIYGLATQKEWVRTLKSQKGIRKLRFFNPLMQNRAHARALSALLPAGTPIYPMVVFGAQAKLYTPTAKELPMEVFKLAKLKNRVRSHPKDALSKGQIEELYSMLSPFTQVAWQEKQEHIQTVLKKH